MKHRNIICWPDLRLMIRSKEVNDVDSSVLSLVEDMICTMDDTGRIALAAPQIGQNKRIFILNMESLSLLDNYPHEKEIFVAIDPKIVDGFGETISLESTSDFPEEDFYVPRAHFISMVYKDIEGNNREINATGFLSIQIQSMIDVLDGCHLIDSLNPHSRRETIERREKRKSDEAALEELYAIYGGD